MLTKKMFAVIVLVLILSIVVSCGKKDTESNVEEIKEMNKGQQEVTDIKDKLSQESNIDTVQNDAKDFDDW